MSLSYALSFSGSCGGIRARETRSVNRWRLSWQIFLINNRWGQPRLAPAEI
jgi:hypothetical protein